MDDDVRVLRPSRWKMVLLLLVCLIFVIASILIFLSGDSSAMAVFGGLFFGLGVVVFMIQMLPNSSWLRLARDGFTTRTMYRTSDIILWNNVSHFQPIRVARNLTVGMTFVEGYEPYQTGRKVVNTLTGIDGTLPDTYGMKAAELADLMNAYIAKYGNSGQS